MMFAAKQYLILFLLNNHPLPGGHGTIGEYELYGKHENNRSGKITTKGDHNLQLRRSRYFRQIQLSIEPQFYSNIILQTIDALLQSCCDV